jgi:hypothetical protein
MLSGSLSSLTESDVLVGGNLVLLGNEIIGFKTAELQEDGTYLLDTLIRGRRGTVPESHTANSRFIPLAGLNVKFLKLSGCNIGSTRYFKAISGGGDILTIDAQSVVLQMNNLRPLSPANVRIEPGVADAPTLIWNRRTRDIVRLFQHSLILEESLLFDVDFTQGETVCHSVQVNEELLEIPEFSHTEDPITVNVYQRSAQFGRGLAGSITYE